MKKLILVLTAAFIVPGATLAEDTPAHEEPGDTSAGVAIVDTLDHHDNRATASIKPSTNSSSDTKDANADNRLLLKARHDK